MKTASFRLSMLGMVLLCAVRPASAAEPPPGPSFGRQVVAVLDRLGCNSGSCHGSFRGQNGFRLSLFGSEPAVDFQYIVPDAFGRRVNFIDPDQSLLLLKPTNQAPHQGGLRLKKDSPEYRLLRDWIAAGARYAPEREAPLTRIEVTPAELVLKPHAGRAALRVQAIYADGGSADVTALSRFEALNDEAAKVDASGVVRAAQPGDTPILARYAGQVVAVQVLVPAEKTAGDAVYSSAGFIDDEINDKLRKLNLAPSALCTDTEFLRRASLDLLGTLPTPSEIRAFEADSKPYKRARKVDELLNRPEYAAYWASKFSDWTGNDTRYLANPYRPRQSKQWHDWFRDKLSRNVPYSDIARGVVAATSTEGQSQEQWQAWAKAEDARLRGTEWNFEYGKRQTLDLLYIKARNLDPDNLALQMSYSFLGVKLECAQCHKHPMDRWTQGDFGSWASTFAYVGVAKEFSREAQPLEAALTNGQQGINEVLHLEKPRKVYVDPRNGQELKPKALGGADLPVGKEHDPRVTLADWLTAPENPYFAKALVNRLWAHYFGRGLVDPPDGLAAANPASHPVLLDELARRFVADNFDLKAVHRQLLNAHAYQRSGQANASNKGDRRNFSRALPRRLGAEQVVDAIAQATGVPPQFDPKDVPPGTRAIEAAPSRLQGSESYALTIFGRPQRQQNCDCERSAQPALPQTLYLFNDTELLNKIKKPGARLDKLLAEHADNGKLVEELYLWTLSRYPNDKERSEALKYLEAEGERKELVEDLIWALLNHREFLVNY
ncbi:MAG: DUF1553 domain-containing protein [Planctomycetia bacterium]|nr:DUF1553 domain-containing protein [Planctomycetia bacterium]